MTNHHIWPPDILEIKEWETPNCPIHDTETDNTGTIQRIFKGSPGKVQAHSQGFRQEIFNILNADEEARVAISWCPSHQGITGNEEADKLAKSGSKLPPVRPNYKTQAYVTALHK